MPADLAKLVRVGSAGFAAWVLSIAARASRKAPVKTREKECASDDSCAAGAREGRVLGSR